MKAGRRLRAAAICHKTSPSARTITGVLARRAHPGRARARPAEERGAREDEAVITAKPSTARQESPRGLFGGGLRDQMGSGSPGSSPIQGPASKTRGPRGGQALPGRQHGAGQAYRSPIPTIRSAPAFHRILPLSFRSSARGLALPSPAALTADRELGPETRPSPCPEGFAYEILTAIIPPATTLSTILSPQDDIRMGWRGPLKGKCWIAGPVARRGPGSGWRNS
jgi:hypothetical protein